MVLGRITLAPPEGHVLFFFQAEDGIRDHCVTGVQTCALPISPPEPVLYKLCKPGWSVIVERIPNAQGTRFVCPFCPKSHRVPGPVRGFKKMRRAQWSRLRRVEE